MQGISLQQREDELRRLVGQVVDERYRIIELLGAGGIGAVYEAEHLGLGRRVALKFIDREYAQVESVASRFTREARAVGRIRSDHIVSVHDTGSCDGRPYLVMELLRGEDLGCRLRRLGKLSIGETLQIAAQTLRGLADAHDAGIVHRDLKPDNVFLLSRGPVVAARSFVKIVDFGMSKMECTDHRVSFITRAGTVIGTPLYMSPEQAQAVADVDGRADLYSLGAMMFECISGRPPHVGEGYEQIIMSICMNDAPDLRSVEPSVSAEVARLVERALRRDRSRRFVSARQMLVAVTTLCEYGAGADVADVADAADVAGVADAAEVADVAEEQVAAKTLLAGGAAEPLRAVRARVEAAVRAEAARVQAARVQAAVRPEAVGPPTPAQDLPVHTVPLAAAPSPAHPESPSSPAPPPTRRSLIVVAGTLAAITGATITMWALPKLLTPATHGEAPPVSTADAAVPSPVILPEEPNP
ncbi:serine/threonine protein kinase [Pendulispora brunnea]|uniref:Serine/threonine protein kinase n=1 Tax=Pendulispora brunnea TaxID=2905690 RepID=A0ABZ2K618_9BACT